MTIITAAGALGAVALLLLAAPASSQMPGDRLIVPGQRIGNWTLMMTVEEITRSLGRYRVVTKVWHPSGVSLDFLTPTQLSVYQWPGAISGGEYVTETRGVTFIETWHLDTWTRSNWFHPAPDPSPNPELKTEKGIGLNSPRAGVLTAYGTPSAVTRFKEFSRLIYNDAGVAFLADDFKVYVTVVFRPGEARTIWKF